jgi:putative hydrolase of the HAD superfamily
MPIRALFLDVGGVLLSNGWDRASRELAVQRFDLDRKETDERHHLTFDTYESGKITLDQYLDRVVFYQPRSFPRQQFIDFMYAQSQSIPEMLQLVRSLKARYGLKVAAVNNEGRELNEHRIRSFQLHNLMDCFASSCYVHLRKPDEEIYRFALDLVQLAPGEVAYLDDRKMFVEVASSLGIHGIHHTGYDSTVEQLAALGLHLEGFPIDL